MNIKIILPKQSQVEIV